MAVEIMLLRHAQSMGNVLGQFIGHTDVEITELGARQVEKLEEFLRPYQIDAIYSSDLKRALDTVAPTAKSHALKINTDVRLREIFGGDWEGVPFDELPTLYPEAQARWLRDPIDSAPTNGESIRQIFNRVKEFMNEVVEKLDGKKVLIVSHATTLRVLECYFLGGLENWANLEYLSNASVSFYKFKDGEYSLVRRNVDEFMGDMVTKLPSNI
ncbi:MAG: histidine phosphatase family protein [Clostridia bacterium]|nr:histidine phosphatase family protein [Clostridia bacterium]